MDKLVFFIAEDYGLPWGFVPVNTPPDARMKPLYEPEVMAAMRRKDFKRGIYSSIETDRANAAYTQRSKNVIQPHNSATSV